MVLLGSAEPVKDQITDAVTQKPNFEAAKQRKSVEDTPPWTDSEDEDLDYFKALAD